MRRAPNELLFGVQIATNDLEEGIAASALVAQSGADWIDLNCGCPIHEATRRGLGSAMLRKPERLATLVKGIANKSTIPVTVKVRLAPEGGEVNVRQVVELLRDAGAAAVTIHGRTSTDRYSRAADWEIIRRVAEDGFARDSKMLLIGNGDIVNHKQAYHRIATSRVDAVMVGRGALTKPWIFGEFRTKEALAPDTSQRIALYRRLTVYMKARSSLRFSLPHAVMATRSHPSSSTLLSSSPVHDTVFRSTLAMMIAGAKRSGASCLGI